MAKPSKREQIVYAAMDLFYQEGFHATGIEKIREKAGVSKKTLYNHFRSKDELMLATLRKREELFMSGFTRKVEQPDTSSRERLAMVFDALDEWFQEKGFYGCMFINASAEFSDLDDPCYKLCAEHKQLVHDYIKDLAEQAGVGDPDELSTQLNLLIEGAIVQAHTCNDKTAAMRAKKMGKVFIEQALP